MQKMLKIWIYKNNLKLSFNIIFNYKTILKKNKKGQLEA